MTVDPARARSAAASAASSARAPGLLKYSAGLVQRTRGGRMGTYNVASSAGAFEIVVDDDGVITEVAGDWPGPGGEFTIAGPIPEHVSLTDVPESVRAKGGGREVCHYDPVHCRTCYCDGKG